MPQLDRDGDVFVLDLGDDENRFDPSSVGALTAALDEVAGADGPRALVTRATGNFCLPEVDISIPFTPGMAALIQARLPQPAQHEAMTTGRRYGGEQAQRSGIVDDAVGVDDVVPAAMERAAQLVGKAGPTLGTIKEQMYASALRLLRTPSVS